jgi:hypothetical protein
MKSGTRMAVRSEPSIVWWNGLRSCPWPCVEGHVHALAKVLPQTVQREHKVKGILEP